MCLYVHEVPESLEESVIIKGRKWLERYDGILYTPVWRQLVRPDGWIFPLNPDELRPDLQIHRERTLYGGLIHMHDNSFRLPYPKRNMHEAYGFGIIAYGFRGDIGVRAVYVPAADRRTARHKHHARIERFYQQKHRPQDIREHLYMLHQRLYQIWNDQRDQWKLMFPE